MTTEWLPSATSWRRFKFETSGSVSSASITFFFSSRRRHTSWPRDWSSDVCSSDLLSRRYRGHEVRVLVLEDGFEYEGRQYASLRSEERRVGKECRSRWSPDRSKKKTITYTHCKGNAKPEATAIAKRLQFLDLRHVS